MDSDFEGIAGWRAYLTETYGEDVARATTRSFGAACKAVLARGGDISLQQAGHINCPALIVAGENDELTPPEAAHDLAARIPNAKAITVPGAGHLVHNDRPEWFVQTLLEFLAKQ
jgi:pimeloyl-ACP methyl ester carboxylesterase